MNTGMGSMTPQGELRPLSLARGLKSKASLAQMHRHRAQRYTCVCASVATAQMS
ncbi:MAG: hypothetical protein Q7J98_14295 [Kiritimatiellia bacterium]|nr:hypothetical protein [Kiritimatiellia bacterium]